MRVAHVSIVHPPHDTRIFHKQCRSLAARGYDVHLLVAGPPDVRDGVRVHSLAPRWERPPLRRQWRLQSSALTAAWRIGADVYHLHDPHLIPLGLALKRRGARVIYDVHEHYPRHALSKLAGRPVRGGLKSATWETLETLARASFDGFVCATEEIATRFPAERAALVRNFPRADEGPHPRAPAYRERPPKVVFVGVQNRMRGLFEAVEAMELLPARLGARLRLVGSIRPLRHAAEVARRPGWRHVEHVPWQPRERVWHELGRARVGLVALHPMPNHLTATGSNKLFEYMAAGLPVITSDQPAWRRVARETGCGLAVDPRDPRALARAIEHLLTNPEEAEEMGRRGRALVESRYNWDADLDALLGLYSTLNGKADAAR